MTSKPEGYDAFRYYRTISIHYKQTRFDVRKYGYDTKIVSRARFENENAKYHYGKLASYFRSRRGLCHFIGVCLYHDPSLYITELSDPDKFDHNWKSYKKFMSAPEHHCKNDIQNAFGGLHTKSDVLKGSNSNLPRFVDLVSENKDTCCYTAIVMNKTFRWFDVVDKSVGETHIIWENVRDRLLKLEAFVFFKETAKYDSIRTSIYDAITDADTLTNLNKSEHTKENTHG